METTNSNQNRKSRRNAFIIASVAAVSIAGALGLGIMYGSSGSDATDDRPQAVRPTSTATQANGDSTEQQPQLIGQVEGSVSQPQQPADSNSGDAGEPAPPTNTPEPPAPTMTPEPAVEEPTDEPEPTDTPEPSPTPDDGFECVVCDEIVELVDIWAPEFLTGGRTHCDEGTIVVVTLDEEADIWVTYTMYGVAQVSEVDHGTFGYFNLGGGPVIFPAMNIMVHAEDASGNQSSVNPGLYDCP